MPDAIDVSVRSNGMNFRVIRSTGRDERAVTYVLVHGLGTSHRYLGRLHDELARSSDVCSIDLPGFGGLSKPAISPTVPDVADALGDVLDGLNLCDVVLVGHSMGAQWAVELGRTRPDLVRGVVLIGPVADDRHRTLVAQSAMLARDILGEPPLTNALVFADYLRAGTVWFLRQARQMVAYPTEDGVAALTQPFLVLRGGNDPIATLAWCRRLRDGGNKGSLVIVPGHRHVVQHTAPRAVASAIRAFVGRSVPALSATP